MTSKLLRRPVAPGSEDGLIARLSSADAGWQMLNFEARRLSKGQSWSHDTQQHEFCLVVLGGRIAVESNHGVFSEIGRRAHVFDGMPYALYLPRDTQFRLQALTDTVEVAAAWVPTDRDFPAHLVTPEQSQIEVRGGHNATRQINSILPPGSNCHRLVCVEVYTPSGNWSSYPPHKHDRHVQSDDGNIAEADLEEIYFYKFRQPEGWAFQRVYTDDRSLDEAIVAHDNDIVLVPEGYHPVSAAYGFDCYYLNFLAGSAQSLACTFDPAYAWTMETWDAKDPRVPLVSHKMEEKVLS
jgi:5-deoxy-glucuronate isomerase